MGYLNASQFRDEFTNIWDGLKVLRQLFWCLAMVDQVAKKCFLASVVAVQEGFVLRAVELGEGGVILVAVDTTKPSRCEGFIWWLRPASIR